MIFLQPPPPPLPIVWYTKAEQHRGSGRRPLEEGENKSLHILLAPDSPHRDWAEHRGNAIGNGSGIIGDFQDVMDFFRDNPRIVGILHDGVSQHYRYHERRDMPDNIIPLSLYREDEERFPFACALVERPRDDRRPDWLVECYAF